MTEKNNRELPIDRGWSWVICFASFLCMFITGTAMQAVSVLFLELVKEFDSTVTVTSLTVMCFVMSLSVSSVLSTSVMIPLFGERLVVIVSGALFAGCTIGYFMAPNIVVFILFAAGKGTCVGMIFVPSISLLSCYFDRRRSLATTMCNSGICVASIVSPPLIRLMTAEYGMRGTFLILAGIELHMVAAGLLMRPVSSYRPVSRENTGLTAIPEDESTLIEDKSQNAKESAKHEAPTDMETNAELLSSSLTQEDNAHNTSHGHNKNGKIVSKNGLYCDSYNSNISEAFLQHTDISNLSETDEQLSDEKSLSRKNSRKESIPRKWSLSQKSSHGSSWSVSNRHREHAIHHDSMLSVTSGLEPALAGVGSQGQLDDEVKDRGWKSCCCIVIIRRIFDPSLFRQWAYKVFLISCLPSATTQYLLQYIPTIAAIKGATKDEAATLMTIIGSVDLVSRLTVGFFADTHLLRASQIVAIAQICLGILCQFNPLFNNFEKMIAMVVFMGLFIGTRQSLMAMVHVEIVGMQKMARCLSISAMLATLSAASHSPMLSAIMEATGSYNIVLHYVGAALIVGAALMLWTPFLARIDTKRETKKIAA